MDYMRRALELAEQGIGSTSPNPSVGAVIVRRGRIVGEGRTQPPPGEHAEVVAIRQSGQVARGSTLYVTMEPCPHYGRTPPCSEAVIAAGIEKVRIAMLDPDPNVDGRGVRQLAAAGLDVSVGEREVEARRLAEAYIKHRREGRPFVIGKFAASLDGRLAAASGDSRWVAGEEARAWAHLLRTKVDAILVGSQTVLADDPLLTARPGGVEVERQLLRVVLDTRGRIPLGARVLTGPAETLLATTETSSQSWRDGIEAAGGRLLICPSVDGHVDLDVLLDRLGRQGVLSLLVEGGGVVLGAFFDRKLIDKLHVVTAPIIVGARDAPSAVVGRGAIHMVDAIRLREVDVQPLGQDVLTSGYPDYMETRN